MKVPLLTKLLIKALGIKLKIVVPVSAAKDKIPVDLNHAESDWE